MSNDDQNQKQWQSNLLNINVWLRLLFMALTLICLFFARILIWVVAVFQFLLVLIAGKDNDNLRNFGQGLSKWVYQCLLFLTFNSEEKPFPFNEWPTVEPSQPYTAPEVEKPQADTQSGETEVELADEPAKVDDVPPLVDKPVSDSNENDGDQKSDSQEDDTQKDDAEKR